MHLERLFIVRKRLKAQRYWNIGTKVKSFHLKQDAEKFVSEMPEDEYEYSIEVEDDLEYEMRQLDYELIWKNQ
jgi:hypothetical protein